MAKAERERRRLDAGVHDHIGGTLAAVRGRLAELRQSESVAEVLQRLEPVEELLGQAIEAARSLTFEPSCPDAALEDQGERMTTREREVLQLIAAGHTNKDVAARLCVSVKTVSTHRQNIMDKLNIHNAVGLVKYAIRQGMTSLDDRARGSNDSRRPG